MDGVAFVDGGEQEWGECRVWVLMGWKAERTTGSGVVPFEVLDREAVGALLLGIPTTLIYFVV